MKNLPTLSIVIPAYNEEKRIEKTIDTLLNEKNELKIKEILIVDDGSIDKTSKIVLTKSHSSNIIKLIQLETNQGKGGALREGVMRATGEYIGCFDADLSASIDSIPHAITMLENDADVVVGTRVTPQGIDLRKTQPLRRRYAGKLFSLLQRLIVGIPYDLLHVVGNITFIIWLANPLTEIMSRKIERGLNLEVSEYEPKPF